MKRRYEKLRDYRKYALSGGHVKTRQRIYEYFVEETNRGLVLKRKIKEHFLSRGQDTEDFLRKVYKESRWKYEPYPNIRARYSRHHVKSILHRYTDNCEDSLQYHKKRVPYENKPVWWD